MSNRLDQDREAELQPKRMESCKKKLEELGYEVKSDGHSLLTFKHNDHKISFWPYSGWHQGKGIKPGRGFKNLLKQLDCDDIPKHKMDAETFSEVFDDLPDGAFFAMAEEYGVEFY